MDCLSWSIPQKTMISGYPPIPGNLHIYIYVHMYIPVHIYRYICICIYIHTPQSHDNWLHYQMWSGLGYDQILSIAYSGLPPIYCHQCELHHKHALILGKTMYIVIGLESVGLKQQQQIYWFNPTDSKLAKLTYHRIIHPIPHYIILLYIIPFP